MRERDPVYFDPALDAWILTRYDDVNEALRSPDLSVDRNGEIGRGQLDVTSRLSELNAAIARGPTLAQAKPPATTPKKN